MSKCQKRVRELLSPFEGKEVTEELKHEVFEVLDQARSRGEIKRRFYVEVVEDPNCEPYLDIILDPFIEESALPLESERKKTSSS